MMQKSLGEILKKWVVNDYFTPNIKAEVILDTLLTPYAAELINRKYGLETVFVTKEMSVRDIEKQTENQKYGNMGTKIDYILADEDFVYLVELKTTDGSIDWEQAENYLRNCEGKTFGDVFGDKLLSIVSKKTGIGLESTAEKEEGLLWLFEKICGGVLGGGYEERGKNLLKAKPGWRSTYKYIYTMGQLLEYLYEKDGRQKAKIWDKQLKLFYIMPAESLPYHKFAQHRDFYLDSISLREAKGYLAEKEEELAQLLVNIIDEIYPE